MAIKEQYFYGHGKLLLTGEYFILDGARAIALPTQKGQRMHVTYRMSSNPKLIWRSYDDEGKLWLDTAYELWHFDCIENSCDAAIVLGKILKAARKQNVHFMRDEADVIVETFLEFPLSWGLGSSSTLVYNIAQLAYISPFELYAQTFGGSGYDIACAQSFTPISYQIKASGPLYFSVTFNPHFKDQLYFLYLNKKQDTRRAIEDYRNRKIENKELVAKMISDLSDQIMRAQDLSEFEDLLLTHENIIAETMGLDRIQYLYFNDYEGVIKSLGAWGGDFALVTSRKCFEETKKYFERKGYSILIPFDDMILSNYAKLRGPERSDELTLYNQRQ